MLWWSCLVVFFVTGLMLLIDLQHWWAYVFVCVIAMVGMFSDEVKP